MVVFATSFFSEEQPKEEQSKDVYIEVTFNSDMYKGKHTFKPEKGNYMSQINIEFSDGYSNLNASKLVSDDGMQIHYINRHFMGEPSKGEKKAKKHTSGCGSLNFIDLKNEKDYKRIDGDFTGCTSTTVKSVSDWKDGIVKKRRLVTGEFSDTVEFKFTMDDGSKKTVIADVKVAFVANESRLK